MEVSFINLARFARVAAPAQAPPIQPQPPAPVRGDLHELRNARVDLLALFESLNELGELLGRAKTVAGVPASVRSDTLTLDNSSTPTTLESLEEINTESTSFGPFGPDWNGGSTALATVGGLYDGSNGTGFLAFDVRTGGVHGQDRLRIRVRENGASVLQNIFVEVTDPIDQQYGLGNGLYLKLGPGALQRNDTLSLNLFDTAGSVVSTANPFDGVRNAMPNFDLGYAVGPGSFLLNNTAINVAGNDSIDAVIARINQSSASVTASFDSASERVVFTQNTLGSTATIDVQGDDSGLLDALKLTGAIATLGRDPDIDRPLADVTQFQGVQSGTMRINGVDIAIDVQTDSLNAILARINQSQADATDEFIASPQQQVTLEASSATTELDVDDGGTGFFAAVGILSTTYRGQRIGHARQAANIAQAFEGMSRRLNAFVRSPGSNSLIGGFANSFEGVLVGLLGGADSAVGSAFGLRLGRSESGRLRVDSRELSQALQYRDRSARALLLGGPRTGSAGLVDSLISSVDAAIGSLDDVIGSPSAVIDLYA